MKNLKKVLAMVLAFACTFTMFAGAKVFEDVPAGSDYSEAITMLSDLGIIQGKDDGKYHPEDTITRAEACALIARMMTGDPNVSQYVGAQNFTDVAKGSWKDSAIGYCYINNIVIGVGNNKFEPDRAITDAEFITMVVRAMGYETPDMVQGYPYTYMSNAQAIGLMDGVDMVANTDALRGEDAQVIYNALFADYARGAKLVNTTHGTSVEQYPTLAESVWGLERAAVGVWRRSTTDDEVMELTTCQAHTWVITGKRLTVGNVDMFEAYPIDDDGTYLYDHGQKSDNEPYYFTYNGDMANIADLKGYQVELWGMGAHDEPELTEVTDENGDRKKVYVYSNDWDINAIKTVNGQTKYDYTPADESLPDVDLDEVRGFVGGTFISNDVDDYIKWSNDNDSHLSESTVEDAMQTKNSASYRIVDWDSDGTADFITGDIYKYYEVKSVTSSKIRLGGFDGRTEFVLDLDGETTGVDIGDENGDAYTIVAEFPDDIEEGDIIQVSSDEVVGKKEITSTWTVEIVEPETKEITSISSKKGVEFDNELIHDAEFYDENQYYFEEGEGNNPDGLDVYNDLNEDSADLWDLYLDNNGFIIKMDEAEAAYNGYIFITGADQGNNSSTGNRRNAMISGVNGENEYMEDLELTRNANVEVWDEDADNGNGDYVDGFDDREFNRAAGNVKGRVFKYTLNDDGDVTRLVEVACENASGDYTYNEENNSVRTEVDDFDQNYGEEGTRNWLQTADVIFAVEVNDEEWDTLTHDVTIPAVGTVTADVENGESIVAGTSLNMSAGDDTVNIDDIDADNVIAIDYTDIPDINNMNGASPAARGIKYNVDASKDEIESVVLGVDDLNDFKSTSTKVALVSQIDWNAKGDKADTYDITAYVNGEEGTEFNTVDVDDMTVNGRTSDQRSIINRINSRIEEEDRNGVYAELRFNKDGKVTEMNIINDTAAYDGAYGNDGANDEAVYNVASVDEHYTVVRAVVNLRNDGDYLMVTPTSIIEDKDGNAKLTTVDNAEFERFYDLESDTAYFKLNDAPRIDDELADGSLAFDGQFMNAYDHGFVDGYEVEAGDKADLVSWIDSINDEYEDAYCVADVVIDDTTPADGDSVVAVYYYEDAVDEYNKLTGGMTLNATNAAADDHTYTADYDTNVSATVSVDDFDEFDGRVRVTVTGEDYSWTSANSAENAAIPLGTLDVGNYNVVAEAWNTAAEDWQHIDTDTLEINKIARADSIAFMKDHSTDTEKTDAYVEDTTTIFVKINGLEGQTVDQLTADDFIVGTANTENLGVASVKAYNNDTVELTLARGLRLDEGTDAGEVRVTLVGTKNYSEVEVKHDVVAAPTDLPIITNATAAAKDGNTIVVTIAGGNVRDYMDPAMWHGVWNGNEYDVTNVTFDDNSNTLTLTVGGDWRTTASTSYQVVYGTDGHSVSFSFTTGA